MANNNCELKRLFLRAEMILNGGRVNRKTKRALKVCQCYKGLADKNNFPDELKSESSKKDIRILRDLINFKAGKQ